MPHALGTLLGFGFNHVTAFTTTCSYKWPQYNWTDANAKYRGLRFDDNGGGMGHGTALNGKGATQMTKLMMVGSDSDYGKARPGKVRPHTQTQTCAHARGVTCEHHDAP